MTKTDPAKPFAFLMEASMLGVGVGFDDKGADKDFAIYEPKETYEYQIPDTREGWVRLLGKTLKAAFLSDTKTTFTYSTQLIRGAGSLIRGFGGTAMDCTA
jgi:hypothetical protein